MRVELYNGIYFGIQFIEIDKFCCYKKNVLIYSSFIVLQYFQESTEVWRMIWKNLDKKVLIVMKIDVLSL